MKVPVSKTHAERKTAMRPQCIFNDYYKTEQIKKKKEMESQVRYYGGD